MTELVYFESYIILIPYALLFSIAFIYFLHHYFKKISSKEDIPKYVEMKTEPPKKITPAMAGYIYDKSFSYNWKYLSAAIIDMAVKNLIKLEYCKDSNKITSIVEGQTDPNEYSEYKFLRSLILVSFGENTKYKEIENKTNKAMDEKHTEKRNLILRFAKKYLIIILILIIIISNYIAELILLLYLTIIITLFIFYHFLKNDRYFLQKEPLKITREDYSEIEKLKTLKIKRNKLWSYIILPEIRKEFKYNMKEYYYLNLNKKGILPYVLFILIISLFLFIVIYSIFTLKLYLTLPGILFTIISTIFFVYYTTTSAIRTPKGNEIYIELLAYKKYLSQRKMINPKIATQELFEKHLPYAIALGVRNNWASRFEENSIKIPKWFIAKNMKGQVESLTIPKPENIAYRLTKEIIYMSDKEVVENGYFIELLTRREYNLK